MVDFVVGFMFSEDKKKVVLMTKNRPQWQVGKINGIGGGMEEGEVFPETMAREFEEEAGVVTKPEDWQEFCIVENQGMCFVHFFRMFTDDANKAKTTTDEEVDIYPVDNLPPNIHHNLNWLINMALDDTIIFDKPVFVLENKKTGKDFKDRCNS